MSENCNLVSSINFRTAAIVVVAPGETLSNGIVQKFVYDVSSDDSFNHEVESAIKDVRKMIRSRWCHLYGGKTVAVFGWYYGYTPIEHAHLIKFIKIQNVAEFKL